MEQRPFIDLAGSRNKALIGKDLCKWCNASSDLLAKTAS